MRTSLGPASGQGDAPQLVQGDLNQRLSADGCWQTNAALGQHHQRGDLVRDRVTPQLFQQRGGPGLALFDLDPHAPEIDAAAGGKGLFVKEGQPCVPQPPGHGLMNILLIKRKGRPQLPQSGNDPLRVCSVSLRLCVFFRHGSSILG